MEKIIIKKTFANESNFGIQLPIKGWYPVRQIKPDQIEQMRQMSALKKVIYR